MFSWTWITQIPTVIALIDFFRRRPDWYWFFVIVFLFPPVGPIVYLLVVALPTGSVEGAVAMTLADRRRKRELEHRVRQTPLPGLLAELGELEFKDKKYEAAIAHLGAAIEKGIDHLEARFYLGLAFEKTGRSREAVEHLVKVVRTDAKFRYGEALLALGRCLVAEDQARDAEAAFRQVLQTHTYAEARVRLAELLEKKGQAAEAQKLYEAVVSDSVGQPRYVRRREGPFVRRAKIRLKTMGLAG